MSNDNKNFEIMSDFDTELIPESEVGVIIPDDDESDSSTSPVHLVRLVVVLTIICTCVALLLSVVNGVTKDIILKNQQAEQEKAILELFPEGDSIIEYTTSSNDLVYIVQDDGFIIGYCVSSVGKGYIDDVSMMISILPDYSIKGLKIVTMSETPGIGTKVKSDSFLQRFIGIKDYVVLGDNVDGIANATYSSKAVAEAVNNALDINLDLEVIAKELDLKLSAVNNTKK